MHVTASGMFSSLLSCPLWSFFLRESECTFKNVDGFPFTVGSHHTYSICKSTWSNVPCHFPTLHRDRVSTTLSFAFSALAILSYLLLLKHIKVMITFWFWSLLNFYTLAESILLETFSFFGSWDAISSSCHLSFWPLFESFFWSFRDVCRGPSIEDACWSRVYLEQGRPFLSSGDITLIRSHWIVWEKAQQ